jgi:hypothetical protein
MPMAVRAAVDQVEVDAVDKLHDGRVVARQRAEREGVAAENNDADAVVGAPGNEFLHHLLRAPAGWA